MLLRRLGAGFSDFDAEQTLPPVGTKLTAPMYTKSKMYYIGAFSFPGLSKDFLKISQYLFDV
jgi:hypothetical protein